MKLADNLQKRKSVLISGKFLDFQILWISHIINSYCRSKEIKNIIFDNEISEINKLYLKKILKDKFNLFFLKKSSTFYEILEFSIPLIKRVPSIISYSLINRKNLIKKKKWHNYQFAHAIWDSSLQNIIESDLDPNFFKKLKYTIFCYLEFLRAIKIAKRFKVKSAFLGHTVYSSRAYILGLRSSNQNIEIIAHANECLYKLGRYKDRSTFIFEKKIWETFFEKQNDILVKDFKKNRIKGRSKNIDVVYASEGSLENKKRIIENQIFLHVFKDSPFNYIDRDRIFADYIDWITNTINIIKNSNEEWNIRLHPGSSRWGEDSKLIIRSILKKLKLKNLPSNVYFSSVKESNINILKNCKRLLTFSGSVALEASCFGIKPITIAETSCNSFQKNLVHKPKTFKEYENLLLKKSSSRLFKQSIKNQEISWKLLFTVEEQISLKTLLNSITLFRSDPKSLDAECYARIKKRLKDKKVLMKLDYLGSELAKDDKFLTAFGLLK